MDEVTATLRTHRHLRPAAEDTWFLYGQDKVMELYNSTVQIFFIVVLALSAIGLLVGGVGVIAIMMISVTERTREIGVRKALGATKGIILWQFLVEAATLTADRRGDGAHHRLGRSRTRSARTPRSTRRSRRSRSSRRW